VAALDEGFKRQVSTFNIAYDSKTMLLLSTLVLIYNSYNNMAAVLDENLVVWSLFMVKRVIKFT
jgi:hypothetical protein